MDEQTITVRLWKMIHSRDTELGELRARCNALEVERDKLRDGLQKIFDDNEAKCGCECDTETCCNRVGEPCSKCDAREALAEGGQDAR